MAKNKNDKDKTESEKMPEEEQESEAMTTQNENIANEVDYKILLQQTLADFDNYKKRISKLLIDAKLDGELNVILKFLPALDSFEKAKVMIKDENILKGVDMIENEIKTSLSQIGVKEMTPQGEKFNPNFHNALSVSHNPDMDDDMISQVYKKGYIYNDKVIRYAQVVVNKKGE